MKKIALIIGSLIILNNLPSLASDGNKDSKDKIDLKKAGDNKKQGQGWRPWAPRPAPIKITPKFRYGAMPIIDIELGTARVIGHLFFAAAHAHLDAEGNGIPSFYEPNIPHGPWCTTPDDYTSRPSENGTKTFHKNDD